MHSDKRKSGISQIGGLPWGSRFCQFYQTRKDLLDILVPYFRAGLDGNESCVWITCGRPGVGDINKALKKEVPDFEDLVKNGQAKVVPYGEWEASGGMSEQHILSRLDEAVSRGFDGLRLAFSAFPEKRGGKISNRPVSDEINRYNIISAFAYPRDKFDAIGLMEIIKDFHFSLVRDGGAWEVIESWETRTVKDALQRSEEKLHSLFTNMSEGFAYHRVVLDKNGKPCDYVFLEVNEAFETLTGLKKKSIIGRKVTEVLPGIEKDPAGWIERYGKVALTGKPSQFESYSEQLEKWYAVSAFSPHKGFFAVTFSDITDRKLAEEALRESENRVRRKLESILSPQGDIGSLELSDIIDAPAVQSLLESFHEISRLPMAIIDLKGKVLVGMGWSRICTKFHRVHPETCKYCIESDTQLSAGVSPGEFKLYKCRNNMWDIATPIVIGGRRVGNIFSGQFFFEDEPLDYEIFRAQAKRYGFDEKEYIAALEDVPRISRAFLEAGIAFLAKLANMLSQQSYSNIKLARSLMERDVLTESLRESERRLNRSQEIAHLGSWELDLANNRLTWSDEVYRIFGLEPREFAATYEAFLNAAHPDDRGAVDAAYADSLREGRDSYEIEHRVVKPGGEVRTVHEKCEHFRDASGRIIRSIGMVHDITARKAMERQKTDFLAMLTHDLKSPLTSIIGFTDLILLKKQVDADTAAMLINIQRGGLKLVRMVEDFLTMARMEAGEFQLGTRPEDIGDMLKRVGEEFRPQAEKKGLAFRCESCEGLPKAPIDRKQMERVIDNLLQNAFNYTPEGGTVTLRAGASGGGITVSVEDTGAGIPAEEQARIFDKYYRSPRTSGIKGTGLGLAIVKAVTEAHGGRVELASQPGIGSKFVVHLPAGENT